jgi:acyl-CoA thioester hydrolase
VQLWIGRIGGASLDICYEVYSPVGVEPRVLYTVAATTLVRVDAASGRPVRIPEEMRELFAQYVEQPVVFGKRH